jgi:aminopeptidase-like protein
LYYKEGSYKGWAEAGYPVALGIPETVALHAASPDPAMTAVINKMLSSIPEDWGFVTANAILKELDEDPNLIMIDVRNEDEVKTPASSRVRSTSRSRISSTEKLIGPSIKMPR